MDFIICVYGDFIVRDVRLKCFPADAPDAFQFQNVLTDAGYDVQLFPCSFNDISLLRR